MRTTTTKLITILLLLSLLCGVLRAQTISGIVLDKEEQPVPNVGVALRIASDSTIIAGTYTDEEGRFELLLDKGTREGDRLEIYCSAIGSKPVNQGVSLSDTFLRIILSEQVQQLSEVVLSADRIKRSADGYVAQVQGDLITQGGCGEDNHLPPQYYQRPVGV